jgi:ADP-ribose pyrophosphatase
MSSKDPAQQTLREWRLSAYEQLREQRPELFENPAGAAYEIVTDPAPQAQVAEQSAAWNRANGIPGQYGDIGIVYQDPFITVIKDAVRFRSGHLGAYVRWIPTMATVTAGAAVLAVHQGKYVLLRHFRHASRRWHWEIARGFGTADEDPADTARREVAEELGADVTDLMPLGYIQVEGGFPRDLPLIFWAEISEPRHLEAEEGIDGILAVSPGELNRMITDGELDDAFTLTAIAYARARGLLG